MIKLIFNKNGIIQITCAAILMGIFLACINLRPGDELSLEAAFLQARDGYIKVATKQYSAAAVFSTLNLLVFIPLIGRIFIDDFDTAKAYMLIRMDKVSKWYEYKTFQSYLYCFYSSFIHNTALLLMAMVMGYRAEQPLFVVRNLVLGTLAGFIILAMIITANNVLCLILKPHLVTMLILGTTMVLITVSTIPFIAAAVFLMLVFLSGTVLLALNFFAAPEVEPKLTVFSVALMGCSIALFVLLLILYCNIYKGSDK